MVTSKISIIRKGIYTSKKVNTDIRLLFLRVEGRCINSPEHLGGTLIDIRKDEEYFYKMPATIKKTTFIALYRKPNSNELWRLVNTEARDY